MNIVSRLKAFMTEFEIQSSQFADACNIPRPTISQILSGRNKKISDEIINKIHIAYPSLSIAWLLFGEGTMINKSSKSTDTQISTQTSIDFTENNTIDIFSPNLGANLSSYENNIHNKAAMHPNKKDIASDEINGSNKFLSNNKKRITNILVFYEDNSFESFTPCGF